MQASFQLRRKHPGKGTILNCVTHSLCAVFVNFALDFAYVTVFEDVCACSRFRWTRRKQVLSSVSFPFISRNSL